MKKILTTLGILLVGILGSLSFFKKVPEPQPQKFGGTGSINIRQEVNITDQYMFTTGARATSSAIVAITDTSYSDPIYYFEAVASTTGTGADAIIELVNANTGASVATISIPSNSNTAYTRFRSASFLPSASSTVEYRAVIRGGMFAGGIGMIASRIVVLQSTNSLTNTETQIEIGSATTSATNTTTLPLQSPKYWSYNSANWDGTVTVYAEATYQNTQTASTTIYTVPGTYTYITSPGVSYAQIELWGSGGAGRCSASTAGGGGGGGGAYARSTTTPAVGSSHTVVVSATTTCNSTTSNDSTYETTTVVADGGVGAGASATGGTGGTVANSTGTVEFAGGNAGNALGTNDTGGGGGGSAGPDGAGTGGQAGQTSVGGNGGNANGVAGTQANGSGAGNGSAGTSATTGGNGGGGSFTTSQGGPGGSPGGGGGGGDTTQTGTNANGGRGQARLTETHGAVGIAIEEDDGNFGSWTFKAQVVSSGVSTSSPTRTRSASFTPTNGRHYRMVASTTNSGATYSVFNGKIVVQQTSGPITKLEPQYLLAPFKLANNTNLQNFLTYWDSADWSGVNTNIIHQVDAEDNSTSVVGIYQTDNTLITNSTVTSPDNSATSTPGICKPASALNLDTKATTNNNDIFSSRLLVQVGITDTATGCSATPGATPTLQSEFFFE